MGKRQRPSWDDTWMSMAATIAKRSLCSRDQVGAVIASTTNRVVAVGYNNPTAGFDHQGENCLAWCPRARDMATLVGYEHDPSMMHKHELTTMETTMDETILEVDGVARYRFNHEDDNLTLMNEIMEKCGWRPRYETDKTRKTSDQPCVSLHAEANALVVCDRTQRELGTIYTTSIPCYDCAKLIANSGLARVVYLETGRGLERLEREKINPLAYLKDQGIGVTRYGPRTR